MPAHCLHNCRSNLVAALVLAGLALAFWGNCLFGGKVPVAAIYQKQMLPWSAVAQAGGETRQWDSLLWDSMAQFYPWRLLLHRAAQSDQLPLWNPYQFCGYPFVGNGQSAMFYPPNWLYFLVHPKVGLGLSATLHFFLGGLFVFGLARAWKLSVLPALFAALAFTYGGFMVTWIELPTLPNSLIWLPLAWWGIELVVRTPSEGPAISRPAVTGLIALTVALGMSLLAGHFQIAAYVWIFTFIYALIRLASPIGGGARRTRRDTRRLSALGWLVLAGLLGLMLAMTQLLPTLELAGYSARGAGGPSAAGFEFHRQRALQPVELATLISPDFLGSPVTNDYPGISYSEHCGFVGAITLLLGLVGLFLRPRRASAWLFGGIALFALWGAMAGPPAMLLYWGVPKLGQAGGFARLLSVWTLAAALWGAVGLQALVESAQGPGRRIVAGLALALLLAQVLPWAYRFNPRAKAEEVYPETELIRQLRARLGSDRYVAINDRKAWGLTKVPSNVILPPNAATVYGLRCVDGYDSLFPAGYREFAAKVEGADPSPLANGNMLLLENAGAWTDQQLADVAVGTETERASARLKPVWAGEGCRILAPIWPQWPHTSVLPMMSNAWPIEVPVNRDSLNAIRLTLPAVRQDAAVVLGESLDAGWLAFADGGKPLEHRSVAGMWRSMFVHPGMRRLELVYFPASVACGLFVSLLALLSLTALATFARGGRRS